MDDFRAYSEVCFAAFGDRVKRWATLNEPWSFTYMGYVTGSFAPGRCSDRSKCPQGDSHRGVHRSSQCLNAHAAAVDAYRHKYQQKQGGHIGIVLNHDFGWAASGHLLRTRRLQRGIMCSRVRGLGSYHLRRLPRVDAAASGRPPEFVEQSRLLRGSYDFLGLNHYTTRFYSMRGEGQRRTLFGSVGDTELGWQDDQGNIEPRRTYMVAARGRKGRHRGCRWCQRL